MNEFRLINKYLRPLSLRNSGALKLSDDIYFDTKKGIAISVDTYVENIHFINSSDPKNFLKRVLRASLSDLYCKGIKPSSYFLSFALRKGLATPVWLKKVRNILKNEQKKFNITLAGGDTTVSSKLVITVIVTGYSKKKPVLRNNCSPNEDIYVTGNIGDSFLGLSILKKKINLGKFNKFFKKKYYEPDLQIKVSSHLKDIASASIDISDGIAQDLNHLCSNSKCGAVIDLNLLPLSYICKKLIKKKKIKLKNIFSKGDDYQILFTSDSKNRSKIYSLSKKLNVKISKIGLIKKDKKIIFIHNMNKFKLEANKMGYMHNFN